ncbi:helix-turn-helix transcriptional regulator [Sungkyunkwania multivorans]|uniref:Helix-turn-helix transcriptional regulator n=1 Tax=Sungkyunkwania multivorans TaxID=1173618 RepID=A0ABW3CWQ0_9FLAO
MTKTLTPIMSLFIALLFVQSSWAQIELQNNEADKKLESLLKEFSSLSSDPEKSTVRAMEIYYQGTELIEEASNDTLKFDFHSKYLRWFLARQFLDEWVYNAKSAAIYAKKLNYTDKYIHLSSYIAIGQIALRKYDSATATYRAIIAHNQKLPNSKTAHTLGSLNNFGIHFYDNLKNNDSALYYFNKMYEFPNSAREKFALQWSIYDNIALVHMTEKRYEEAKKLFTINYEFYGKNIQNGTKDYERWFRAGLQLADVEMKLNHFTKAIELIKEVERYFKNAPPYDDSIKTRLLLIKTQGDYYRGVGALTQAGICSDRLIRMKDSLSALDQANILGDQTLFRKIALERTQNSLEKEKKIRLSEIDRAEQRLSFVLLFCLLLVVGLYLIYAKNRQRLLAVRTENALIEEKARTASLKNQLLASEMELKKRDLADFALNISQNQEWAKEILEKISVIKGSKGRTKGKQLQLLEKDVARKIKVEDRTIDFKDRVEKLSNEFYEKLRAHFPQLTRSEVRLCSLIRLNIDNPEIAMLQNVSPQSVYKSRFRLRKKLGLSKEVDLNMFLKEF